MTVLQKKFSTLSSKVGGLDVPARTPCFAFRGATLDARHRAARAAVWPGPGLQQMTSTSSSGSSVITLQFNLSLNIDVAEQEVQQSINASGTYLPADLPTPPVTAK